MIKQYCIIIFLLTSLLQCTILTAQVNGTKKASVSTVNPSINNLVQGNKKMPAVFAAPITEALSHYPELNNTKITWRIKHAYTPLSTRPAITSFFKSKYKRAYIITISDKTIDTLQHLLYNNLSYDEKVGIMGHELGHVVDFRSKNLWQSAQNVWGHLSKEYIDSVEFHTDMICIQHGLGKQLKEYSVYVRTKMHVHDWRGVDNVYKNDNKHERYMNPDTIAKYAAAMHTKK